MQQSAEQSVREKAELDGRLTELQSSNGELLVRLDAERAEKASVAVELTLVKEKLEQANEVSSVSNLLDHAYSFLSPLSILYSVVFDFCSVN